MEVDGKEFVRNLGIEEDKERLIREQRKLEEQKRDAIKKSNDFLDESELEQSAFVDLSINNSPNPNDNNPQINDIKLDSNDNIDNKKRYIVLGFGLVLLFIITILTIRLISNNDTQEEYESNDNIEQILQKDDILDKIDTNEEYQKVIDRKKSIEELNTNEVKKDVLKEIVIPEVNKVNTPLVIEQPKPKVEPKRDLFGLDKTEKTVSNEKQIVKPTPKPLEKQVVKNIPKKETKIVPPIVKEEKIKVNTVGKREVVIDPPKEKNFTKRRTSISGYFIQIGAFTKKPSAKLINSIQAKGYNYEIYQMNIKGKIYNKVLIGAYPSRGTASNVLKKVRADFNNPKAYILKI